MQLTSQRTERGVTERDFTVEGARDSVPGVLWTPEEPATTGPRPLVLLGHGGTQHKRVPNITALARRLVRHHGIAAAAIDLPNHGDRMSEEERSLSREDRRRRMRERMRAERGHQAASQRASGDWTATLDALQAQDDVGAGPVGYWGVSMGTRYGVPLVAAEPRIRAAVLGLFGWAPGPRLAGYDDEARGITVPLLFLVQWDDEVAAREYALALFDLFGSTTKTLHANPGRHVEIPPAEYQASEAFLALHLLS
jgi:dienelactone hydrolase